MSSALRYAEIIDAYRIVPRLSMVAFWLFVTRTAEWFFALPEPTTQQAAFATAVVSSIIPYVGWYQSTGRKWGGSQ